MYSVADPKSSFITGLEYNPITLQLTVAIRGQPYTYDGVSPITAKAMAAAPSLGAFYNKAIRGHYLEYRS